MAGTLDNYYDANNTAPAIDCFAVTPADSDFANGVVIRGLYVGGTGNVTIRTPRGTDVQFQAVPVGAILPVMAKQVRSTGTTATLMVGII